MKDYQGFKNNGNWYKGNLHSHTTVSDGKMTPEQSVEVYKEHGYNFLALSEHDIYTDYRKQYNTDNFIMIPGNYHYCPNLCRLWVLFHRK